MNLAGAESAGLTTLARHEAAGTYRDVILMTLPLLAISTYLNGWRVPVLCLVAVLTAHLCDRVAALMRRREYDKSDVSSLAFVLIVTMLLPASVPYYVVVSTATITVLVAKHAFGGYGSYIFYPPAVGYAVAAVSWPDLVFRYPQPFTRLTVASTTEATLVSGASHTLAAGGLPNISIFNLLLGNYAGPLGTTAVLVVLACATFLWMRKRLTLAVPVGFLVACAGIAYFFPRLGGIGLAWPWQFVRYRLLIVLYELLSGALLFAAVFLINDPVTLPKSQLSRLVYGLLLGVATMMFRYYGAYDLGVCFAVLLMNAMVGPIDRTVQACVSAVHGRMHARAAGAPKAAGAGRAKPQGTAQDGPAVPSAGREPKKQSKSAPHPAPHAAAPGAQASDVGAAQTQPPHAAVPGAQASAAGVKQQGRGARRNGEK